MSDELKAKIKWSCKQVRFMATNKVETIEDLETFSKTNYEEHRNLMGKRENLWKRYRRAKDSEKHSEILAEINDIQPKIKELRKYDNYCKNIRKQSQSIQEKLNNFNKDLNKEKDNARVF